MAKSRSHNLLNYRFLGTKGFQAFAVLLFSLQGKLPFKDGLQPLLSGGFKTKQQRSRFRHLFFDFVNKTFGPFTLYGQPFIPASENYVEAVAWIEEVIVSNQYHTELLKDGSVVIDAGANIGVFSSKVAHDGPHSMVYSFEPTPRTFEALTQNTASYPNITRFNLGLGEEAGKKTLSIWDDFSGSNGISRAASTSSDFGEPDRVESINVTTIDEIAKNLPRVDFIKIDTEGYEANILKGASETIKKWKPVIAMAAYHYPSDKEELPKLVRSLCPDYVCELRHDNEENLICRVL